MGDIPIKDEYSTTEACKLLGIASRTSIWEAIKKGELKAREHGKRGLLRIAHDDLVEYARKNNYRIPPSR